MNTGLQDAVNLGWKLAGVVNGLAPEALLDSYDVERRPVGKRLIDNTRAQGELIRNLLSDGDALWNAFDELLKVPETNLYVARMITAVDTIYREPLIGVGMGPPNEWTGVRLRDADLRLPDGSTTTLYALLSDGRWIDLRLYDGAPALQPPGFPSDWVKTVAAAPADEASPLNRFASVLIRPDGHVAITA